MGWTSINPSYFDVNYRGTIGFNTLPYVPIVTSKVQDMMRFMQHFETSISKSGQRQEKTKVRMGPADGSFGGDVTNDKWWFHGDLSN